MATSISLDIHAVTDDEFGPPEDSYAGYLDQTLAVFEQQQHPFILVDDLSMRWSGSNPAPNRHFGVLVRTSDREKIAAALVASGEWTWTTTPYVQKPGEYVTYSGYANKTAIPDVWLRYSRPERSFVASLGIEYLRLWPENLYLLAVADCQQIQVPDIWCIPTVMMEDEYYRDPHLRFGPRRLWTIQADGERIMPGPMGRCKKLRRDIPIYIPSIELHLNALLDQHREELFTGLTNGNFPDWHVGNFIRYHVWDWPPAKDWLLSCKVRDRNYRDMKHFLDKYVRKRLCLIDDVDGKKYLCNSIMPWELTPRPHRAKPGDPWHPKLLEIYEAGREGFTLENMDYIITTPRAPGRHIPGLD